MNIKGFPDLTSLKPTDSGRTMTFAEWKPELAGKVQFNQDTLTISDEARKHIHENSVSAEELEKQMNNAKNTSEFETLDMSGAPSAKEMAANQKESFERVFHAYYNQLKNAGLTDRTPLANAFNDKLNSADDDETFREMVKKDFEEINNLPTSKAETLDDLRDTVGKSFKTEDLEKLMEKYDPDAYSEYSEFAKTADGARTRSGLSYLSKWIEKVKKSLNGGSVSGSSAGISEKNEAKLSKKAQAFLEKLRKDYGDYEFMIGNGSDELKALAKSGTKEFSVIFSNEEIERMASDEKYAKEKMQGVEGAVKMSKRICEENGFASMFGKNGGSKGIFSNISISLSGDSGLKMIIELHESLSGQNNRKATVEASYSKELSEKLKNFSFDTTIRS